MDAYIQLEMRTIHDAFVPPKYNDEAGDEEKMANECTQLHRERQEVGHDVGHK